MKRRDFLRASLVSTFAGLGTLGLSPTRSLIRAAEAATGKTLVVIFQRGGCDALNTCIPFGEESYYSLRPQIAIAPPDTMDPAAAINLNGFFGLHPGLSPLKAIYDIGDLAVLPAVHYPDGAHSHFDGQHFIETGARTKELDGWLNRHLQIVPKTVPLRAVGFGDKLRHSLYGSEQVSVFRELNEFGYGVTSKTEADIMRDLKNVYALPADVSNPYRQWLKNVGQTMIHDIDLVSQIDTANYLPSNSASYPATRYGRQLRQVAQLIKTNIGLEVATLDIGSWDTHSGQGGGNSDGRQYKLHDELSKGINALYQDLGEQMNDVVIMTCTEFGRTAKQNASGGTDHGNAATWFVVGKSVRGGIYGEWPGLSADQLYRGRFLDFTVDYRDIMGDILWRHLGNNNLDKMLLGHQYTPLGLFG